MAGGVIKVLPEVSGRPMIEYNQADMFQTACKYK